MVSFNKTSLLLLGFTSSLCLINGAIAQNSAVVSEIEKQVESLKTQIPSDNQVEAFQIEQAEFDRLRQQLMETEKSILEGAASGPDLTSENETTQRSEAKTRIVDPEFVDTSASLLAPETKLESMEQVKAEIKAQKASAKPNKNRTTNGDLDRAKFLEKELQETKNKLLVAETEIERLNSIISSQNNPTSQDKDQNTAVIFSTAKARISNGDPDAAIVTVVTDTATLRTAPSETSTKIMEVDNGQRLRVDDRQGDWFRISTSSGMRAWISAGHVAFGPSESSSPSATIKIKPVSNSQQDEDARAFALIKNRGNN